MGFYRNSSSGPLGGLAALVGNSTDAALREVAPNMVVLTREPQAAGPVERVEKKIRERSTGSKVWPNYP